MFLEMERQAISDQQLPCWSTVAKTEEEGCREKELRGKVWKIGRKLYVFSVLCLDCRVGYCLYSHAALMMSKKTPCTVRHSCVIPRPAL